MPFSTLRVAAPRKKARMNGVQDLRVRLTKMPPRMLREIVRLGKRHARLERAEERGELTKAQLKLKAKIETRLRGLR